MRVVSVGIDVGGTFTDLLAIDAEGRAHARKVPSTPGDQSEGILDVLRALGVEPSSVERIVHGSTVATNMLLERTGARVALCATEGATDLLELRRQDRASLYDLTRHHAPPLAAAGDVIGVAERTGPGGVERPLDAGGIAAAVDAASALGAGAVAVALLHAYADPDHELALARALRERLGTGTPVVVSHEVLPEIREYERTATAVAEAYLRPGVGRYLDALVTRLGGTGFPAPAVMTSAGGMRPAAEAAGCAASLALSGPAGGMVAAAALARRAGIATALTIDVGGTSADAGLIVKGEALVEPGGDVAGVPIALPRVLIETVSAGGGSIAWVDDGGALRVGPRSAGAEPGPAAYGRGGSDATVTDAHLVLGHIAARGISGGVTLDAVRAREVVARVADRLGADVERTARAIVATADAEMARALRRVSVERGIDPRRCTLIAFGGAGPLHGCALAERLGVAQVYVPPFAGVLSAMGLAISARRGEAMASVMRVADAMPGEELATRMDDLAHRARVAGRDTLQWWARARYRGQGHELDVPVARGDGGAAVASRFAALHRERARFALDREVEIVSLRCTATGEGLPLPGGGDTVGETHGPATIALADATLLVAPGWTATPALHGGAFVRRSG